MSVSQSVVCLYIDQYMKILMCVCVCVCVCVYVCVCMTEVGCSWGGTNSKKLLYVYLTEVKDALFCCISAISYLSMLS